MKRFVFLISTITAIGLILIGVWQLERVEQSKLLDELQLYTVQRGDLSIQVDGNGVVSSNQSAALTWKITGEVKEVHVSLGEVVSKGDILASLDHGSLPPQVLLAKANLITAQNALDNMLQSQLRQAQAQKAVHEAQLALEKALNPELAQAEAAEAVAEAQKALEEAATRYAIISTPPSQDVIDQAYATLLLAEDRVAQVEYFIYRLEQGDIRVASTDLLDYEIKQDIRNSITKLLKQAEFFLIQEKQKYAAALERYNALLEPPDPVDLLVAEAELREAEARLQEAKSEWERIKDGFSPADIAVLQEELEQAQREWERLKKGPPAEEITLLEAQIAASQAALNQINITAPFDGVISQVKIQPGDQIQPGTLAFRIDDFSEILVTGNVSEIYVNRVKPGQKVFLTLDAVFAKEYLGEVVDIAMVGTEILGVVNYPITVKIINPDEAIKPGMTASISIVVQEVDNAILIPSQSIRGLAGEKVVYVLNVLVNQNEANESLEGLSVTELAQQLRQDFASIINRIHPVTVQIGSTSGGLSQVLAGDLKVGDLVVINPPENLFAP